MDETVVKHSMNDVSEFPSPINFVTKEDFEDAVKFVQKYEDSKKETKHIDSVDETNQNCLLQQETLFSPARIRAEQEVEDIACISNTASPRTYRDCLKIFNLVHNHFSGVPNGYKKLCSALFDAYNESLSSVATNSTKGSTRVCQILSFPEIHLSPRRSRKRSAGFL
jgi:DNA integrity scanning protein DisA with diadenylate cyclase activity